MQFSIVEGTLLTTTHYFLLVCLLYSTVITQTFQISCEGRVLHKIEIVYRARVSDERVRIVTGLLIDELESQPPSRCDVLGI